MEAANDAFGPLKKEIEHAQKILSAWEAALKQGQGASFVILARWSRMILGGGRVPDRVTFALHTQNKTPMGQGVAVVDGRLVEALHVDEAQRMLALQRNIEASKVGSFHSFEVGCTGSAWESVPGSGGL